MPARSNQNLTKAESAALRSIAEKHGITAESGPFAGQGSTFQLMLHIIDGQVLTILLNDTKRLAAWLTAQTTGDALLDEELQSLARQLG